MFRILLISIFLIQGDLSHGSTRYLVGEILDGEFTQADGKTLKKDYATLIGDLTAIVDRDERDNVVAALKIIGDHFYQARIMKMASRYYTLALSVLEDPDLTHFLSSKGINPPYDQSSIQRGLESS